MNIAHVLSHASERFGGVPISTHQLALRQACIGANPSLWSAGTRQDRQEIVEAGIPAHIFEIKSLSSWRRCPDLTAALNAASSQLDLFHLHDLWAYPQYIAARTARKKNIPYILSPHASLAPWRLRDKRLKKAAYLYACGNTVIRNATALHAVAANEIPDFRKAGYSGPVFVTHNGIDPDMFRHMPAKEEGDVLWPAVKGKRVVLFLSRFSIEKGLDLLIPAWADIAGRPSYADVLLVLAGRDYRSYGLKLRALIRQLNLQDRVFFTGMVRGCDKMTLLARADIFVLPSYSEGFSISLLENLAAGTPSLITPGCNFPEAVASGAAICVDPKRDSVRAGLNKFLDMSTQDLVEMGAKGRRLVLEQYSVQTTARKMVAVYNAILGGHEIPLHPAPVELDAAGKAVFLPDSTNLTLGGNLPHARIEHSKGLDI
jgi:glycosyltransferase involved in cell wall biosynthesis